MNGTWSQKWKKALIWFSGYIDFVAFALVGGYAIVKTEDEDLKKTAKQVFVVTLIFAVLSALLGIYNYCGNLFFDNYGYSSDAYEFYQVATNLVNLARIIVYAVFLVLTFVKKEEEK